MAIAHSFSEQKELTEKLLLGGSDCLRDIGASSEAADIAAEEENEAGAGGEAKEEAGGETKE